MRTMNAIATIALIFTFSGAMAQDSLNVTQVARFDSHGWVGNAVVVEIEGECAYVIDETAGLRIVDVSRPVEPREIGGFSPREPVYGVEVVESIGYLAMGTNGLIILDLSDPANPEVRGRLENVGNARGVTLSGGCLYVAAGADGLVIVDVEDIDNPQILGSVQTADFALEAAIAGDYAFVADREGGLRVISLADKQNPQAVCSIATTGETRDVVIGGEYAYLGESNQISQVDISDPAGSHRMNSCRVGQPAMGIAVEGGYVYVALQANGIIEVHEISEGLPKIGDIHSYPYGPRDVATGNGYVYTVSRDLGLRVVDASTPEKPFEVGRCGTAIDFSSVAYFSSRVFFNTYPVGVIMYDVSSPEQPHLIWQDAPDSYIIGRSLGIVDTMLYTLDERRDDAPLRIADISEPDHPDWLGRTDSISAGPRRLRIDKGEEKVYCIKVSGNIDIYDFSDPASPRYIGNIWGDDAGEYNDLVVRNDIGYFAAQRGGLIIRELADLGDVRELNLFETRSEPLSIVLLDDLAFVGCDGGIQAINIADPYDLQEVGFIELPGEVRQIIVEGDCAFIACGEGGFRIVSIADPAQMFETGYYQTTNSIREIALGENLIFAAEESGWGIYDCYQAISIASSVSVTIPFIPNSLSLSAYPNPFNSSTTIRFTLPKAGSVSLELFDPLGRLVRDLTPKGWFEAGEHNVNWDASAAASGVYMLRMEAAQYRGSMPVSLIK